MEIARVRLTERYLAGDLNDLEFATLEWVDWFNNRRLHGAIGYVPPAEYEASCYSSRIPYMVKTQLSESP